MTEAEEKNKGGRPTKRCPKTEDLVIACLSAGSTKDGACKAAGIDPKTLLNWEKADPGFRERVRLAVEGSEATLAAYVMKAAPDDWRAAIALLERRFPERWSKRTQLSVGGSLNVTQEDEAMLDKVYGAEDPPAEAAPGAPEQEAAQATT